MVPSRPSPALTTESPDQEPVAAFGAEVQRRAFLRMMSHELRTPLNSIIGFADILSSELYGPLGAPEYRDYAEIIGVSGYRLLNLVNSALEIIRLEAGTAELHLDAAAMDEAVDDALQAVSADAQTRGVSIAFDPPRPSPTVLGDARALRMVALNLVQNAVTWSPSGGVIRVSITAEGALVRLEISDEGEGINPTELSRLMQPFEQGENALSRRSEGAGLGWPLVKRLVAAMGGEFRIEPGQGEGLRAIVTLRRAG